VYANDKHAAVATRGHYQQFAISPIIVTQYTTVNKLSTVTTPIFFFGRAFSKSYTVPAKEVIAFLYKKSSDSETVDYQTSQ
jgi:hypothetical protein